MRSLCAKRGILKEVSHMAQTVRVTVKTVVRVTTSRRVVRR